MDRLEKSVEGPASGSQEEARTALVAGAAAEVAGNPMGPECSQTGREEGHHVRSQWEEAVAPFVDVRRVQEGAGSVLEQVHEVAEQRIDQV